VFVFGRCIIYLFSSYPYNMLSYRLCQQDSFISLGKKYHVVSDSICGVWTGARTQVGG